MRMLGAKVPRMHDDHEASADDETRSDIPAAVAAPVSDLLMPYGQHHAETGKLHPGSWAASQSPAPEAYYPVTFGELEEQDQVILYGQICRVTKKPFRHTPLDAPPGTPCDLGEGWVHIRLWWDGREHSTAERAGDLVAVSRPAHG